MQIGLGINRTLVLREAADAIALQLSEPNGQTVSWQLDVWALTAAGRTFVGTINTVAASIGSQSNRLVGHAVCPGARSWSIEATGPAPAPGSSGAFTTSLGYLHASRCAEAPPGWETGVFPVRGRQLRFGGPLAASRTDALAPVRFKGVFGSNEYGDNAWLMLFNQATVPANGTQPFKGYSFHVQAAQEFNFSLDESEFFSSALTWALSITDDTLTTTAGKFRVTTVLEW